MMNTELNTYTTRGLNETELLYNPPHLVRITLNLLDGGLVVIGTRQELFPLTSGQGITLPPNNSNPVSFVLPKENKLYVASDSRNRVDYIAEPIPFLGQILEGVERIGNLLQGRIRQR